MLSLIVLLFLNAGCYNQRPQLNCSTYAEASVSDTINEEEWKAVGRGLHLSFGSKDLKYAKGKVPVLTVTKDKQINVWKGERVSLQAILWSAYDVKQVECVWNDIVSSENDTLSADMIQTRFVRYVMSDIGFVSPESKKCSQRDSCVIADPLDELLCMNMEAKTVRPVWITIKVPETISGGSYTMVLMVYSKANPPQELRLTVNVSEQKLPPSSEWSFHTHLNINPHAIAQWHGVKAWSDKHFKQLEPYQHLMSLSGQKSIASNLFYHDNYNSPEEAFDVQMIKWTKNTKGHIKGDYTIFDKWVKQSESLLGATQIDCYTILPKQTNVFVYYDENLKRIVADEIDLTKNKRFVKECLVDLTKHLNQKTWFERAVIVIGEGEIEDVA